MWTPTKPGVNEGRLDALRNLLVNNLANLNTSLTYDGMWSSSREITSDMFVIGDQQDIPDKNVAPLFFCIFGAEDEDTIRRKTQESSFTNGHVHEFETIILVYLQPQVLATEGMVTKKERILSRIIDWLTDGVLNAKANERISLPSQVYHSGSSYDYMTGLVESVKKRPLPASYGSSQLLPGAKLIYRSWNG